MADSNFSTHQPENAMWKPLNWELMYSGIHKMRLEMPPAPVDTMGWDIDRGVGTDEKTKRYHILVSLMLSSQTKDEVGMPFEIAVFSIRYLLFTVAIRNRLLLYPFPKVLPID